MSREALPLRPERDNFTTRRPVKPFGLTRLTIVLPTSDFAPTACRYDNGAYPPPAAACASAAFHPQRPYESGAKRLNLTARRRRPNAFCADAGLRRHFCRGRPRKANSELWTVNRPRELTPCESITLVPYRSNRRWDPASVHTQASSRRRNGESEVESGAPAPNRAIIDLRDAMEPDALRATVDRR